jgi:hypothetical protein
MQDANLPYLVAVEIDAGPAKPASRFIVKVIRTLSPEGSFAVAVNRQNGAALFCRFALEADAERVAAALQASPADRYAGWKRQWFAAVDGISRSNPG